MASVNRVELNNGYFVLHLYSPFFGSISKKKKKKGDWKKNFLAFHQISLKYFSNLRIPFYMQHLRNRSITATLFNHIPCAIGCFLTASACRAPWIQAWNSFILYWSTFFSHFGFRVTVAAFIPCGIKSQKANTIRQIIIFMILRFRAALSLFVKQGNSHGGLACLAPWVRLRLLKGL